MIRKRPGLGQQEIDRLTRLHMDALVVDTHSDTIWVEHLREWGMRPSEMQASFAKLKKGGVDVEFCAISGNFGAVEDHLVENTAYNLWALDKLYGEIGASSGSVILARDSEDVLEAKSADRDSVPLALALLVITLLRSR